MLPDFAKLKSDLSRRLLLFMESRKKEHLGAFSQSPRVRLFEGQGSKMIRESGEVEQVNPSDLSTTIILGDDEVPTLTLEDLLLRLDSAAKEMAGQQAKRAYEIVAEAAKQVGNSVDAKQNRVSAEMILEGLSRVHIEFDRNGRPLMPSIHCHPDLEKAVQLASDELKRNPDLREQMKELMILKKEEWRVREASRRLVG